jgi:hypothetical protein
MEINNGVQLAIAIIAVINVLYYTWAAIKERHGLELRLLAPVQAISDGVDRCKEMGRPAYMTIGAAADLSGLYAPMTLAGINIMRYTVNLCILRDVEPYLAVPRNPEAQPLIDGIYREVCVANGKPEAYHADHVRWFGNVWAGYGIGNAGLVDQIRPGMNVHAGALVGTGDISNSVTGRTHKSLMIGGNCRWTHQGVHSLWYDYQLWAPDVFAAGAYCSGDALMRSSIVAQDLLVWFFVAFCLGVAVLGIAGFPVVEWVSP